MKSITEIHKELDDIILNESFYDLKDIIDWFRLLEIKEVKQHIGFEDENYCRVPLIANEQYNLLLCCWKPGQNAPLHGHPDQGCLVKILSGSLTEEVVYNNGEKEIRINTATDVAYIHDAIGKHSVSNDSDQDAISLHLYAPGGYVPEMNR